ncbi:MAG: hypothetical protein ACRECN_01095, partial [Methylocella sp.]
FMPRMGFVRFRLGTSNPVANLFDQPDCCGLRAKFDTSVALDQDIKLADSGAGLIDPEPMAPPYDK